MEKNKAISKSKTDDKKNGNQKFEEYVQCEQAFDKKEQELKIYFEILQENHIITNEKDEQINSLIDDCYRLLGDLNECFQSICEDDDEQFANLFLKLQTKRSGLDSLKDTINRFIALLWRESMSSQIEKNENLASSISQMNIQNNEITASVAAIKNDSNETLKKALASQKAVEEMSNRFITIVALLVSLLAIIFGNIAQFTSKSLSWTSVLITNSSILLSTCVIFLIIENVHIFSIRLLSDEDEQTRIDKYRLVFNIFLSICIAALILAIVITILCD